VTGYGDIKFKAGTFKVFRIVADNRWEKANRPADEVYFYCPELVIICKCESLEFDSKSEVVEVRSALR